MPEISDSFAGELRERLAAAGIEAVLIGALAAAHYRDAPRLTTDVDFLARSLQGIEQALGEGYSVRTMADSDGVPYVAFIRGPDVTIDVLLAETDYQREAMDRAVDGVITVEDVLVHKLLAWRSRDRDDIASIVAAGNHFDEAYVERWANAWGVRDRWHEVLGWRS